MNGLDIFHKNCILNYELYTLFYTNVGKMFEKVCSDTQYFIIYGDTQMTEECIERGGTRSVPDDQKAFSACFVSSRNDIVAIR
jgi:hypothetical protein